jgi:hypothetical protein
MVRGKALIVGVSQPLESTGWRASHLSGVDSDCRNMQHLLRDDCYFDVQTLQDSAATHDAVLAAIRAAKDTLKRGDFFVFVYSGHGGQERDASGDEDDQFDEVLLTYDKVIVDDELAELWVQFKPGVRLLTLMDACHSGTMARKAATRGEVSELVSSPARPLMLGLPAAVDQPNARTAGSSEFKIKAKLIHLSACRDDQLAEDTRHGGVFTLAVLEAMKNPPAADYRKLHTEIRENLAGRRQVGELYAYGPGKTAFLRQHPFKIDSQHAATVAASSRTLAEAHLASTSADPGHRAASPSARGIILTNPPKHRLDLVLDGNSITEVRAKAYVLGLVDGVTPAGPAGAIDELLGGTIRDLVSRRMFSARVGEVFMLPTGNSPVLADVLLFVGLGPLDKFIGNPQEIQKFIAGNVIRTLVQVGIDEFATVLIGGGSGQSVQKTLSSLVNGFVDGLRDADPGDRTRRVLLCENNAQRYAEMVDLVYAYARTASFDGIGLTIYERPARAAHRSRPLTSAAVAKSRSRVFLHVRHQSGQERDSYESILLTSSGKATAIPSSKSFDPREQEELLRPVGSSAFRVDEFGEKLAKFALSDKFIETFSGPDASEQHLVIVHDAESSKLPWETLRCGKQAIALRGGISRKYLLTGDYSIAKWLEKRRFGKTLDILLIVNPTEDLDGAEREGEIIRRLIKDIPAVNVSEIGGKAATKKRLLREFQSGRYDVIHYAGHAEFNSESPELSGILCSDEQVLSGADLTTIGDLPALVFFNACESGRLRKPPKPIKRLAESVSFAEAFLRGGIANFIGTYWPVCDESAEAFAKTFYGGLVSGQPIGDALIDGRRVVKHLAKRCSYDWADYIHYGDPDFQVKAVGERE